MIFDIKLYLGGIAGDEAAVPDRIKKGQLDGEMAAVTCERMAPSLRVLRIPGMIRRRDEANFIIDRLRPTVDAEFKQRLPARRAGVGRLRHLVHQDAGAHHGRAARAQAVDIGKLSGAVAAAMKNLGLNVVPLPVDEAGKA